MNEELVSQIEDLGLSNKEARVYLANLMLGPAGVQQIADTSGIKRVTTYVILESLVGLGLVSQTSKAKKTLFNAEAPENLQRLIEKREQSLKDQRQQLKDLLPELASLKTLPKEAPGVKFYDGAEGIRTITKTFFAELVKGGEKEVYGISNLDHVHAFFPDFAESGSNPDRVKSGIKSMYLYTSSKGPVYKKTDPVVNRESRYLPDKYKFMGDLSITGNKVAFLALSGSKPIGVVIENAELAQTMKTLFKLAWDTADKYS